MKDQGSGQKIPGENDAKKKAAGWFFQFFSETAVCQYLSVYLFGPPVVQKSVDLADDILSFWRSSLRAGCRQFTAVGHPEPNRGDDVPPHPGKVFPVGANIGFKPKTKGSRKFKSTRLPMIVPRPQPTHRPGVHRTHPTL
jgi:hypothetical protein